MERMRRYTGALDAVERYRQLPYTLPPPLSVPAIGRAE
jgi:hypothetical protein